MRFQLPPFERDSRANTLKAYEFGGEVNGMPSWVDLCGPDEAITQIELAFPEAVRQVRLPAEREQDWTHRLWFAGPIPPGFMTLIQFLQSWLTLTQTAYVDVAVAAQWYKIPEEGVDPYHWRNTEAGNIVNQGKYRGDEAAKYKLGSALAELISRHPLYATAQSILSIPGHDNDGNSFGEKVAADVAARRGLPLIQTGSTLGPRTSAKQSGSSYLMGTMIIPQRLYGTTIIVDDVYQSGGSIRATAYAARHAGAQMVLAIVGARTMRN
ncbi:phosphoribosyltransferase [Paractinoplanes globisporus]|uniref:Phosphoribosyltransferase n=1 Tax=Paractinoplanes globisporus TaxID=113565 RepID=A0ABW6WKU3_9ACTN|nr:phosphoribosyltransferase [Actinoplanes globisporus]